MRRRVCSWDIFSFPRTDRVGCGVTRRAEAAGGGGSAVDVVEDLADEFRIGDVPYDLQLTAAEGAERDV